MPLSLTSHAARLDVDQIRFQHRDVGQDDVDRRQKDLAKSPAARVHGQDEVKVRDHDLMPGSRGGGHGDLPLVELVALAVGRQGREVGVRQHHSRRHRVIAPGDVSSEALHVRQPLRGGLDGAARLEEDTRGVPGTVDEDVA
jgi:hypothetical protein